MKYIKRSNRRSKTKHIIEAFEIDEEFMDNMFKNYDMKFCKNIDTHYPIWIQKAIIKKPRDLGSIYVEESPDKINTVYINIKGGLQKLIAGYWIIKERDGNLYAMYQDGFKDTYEKYK